ncbi:MAG: hypothetical protein A2277_01400 [Desulfobacterales bacterium RIFOXYA12_FULL_46_15]|nr:MAG: hypothetical protein A2097_08030 [Desulfobacula sp. GWF2_41_7]OGR27756.1 MAG: hypothetical protein A2277_01400 [Desulfobacterales bacterium RIFOXYA12_FULL_46_15]
MNETMDIRDRSILSGDKVLKLNFINDSGPYIFRRYYRSGLRSLIFEVLLAKDVEKETQGEIIDGLKMFPRAKPKKMFRILRNRFTSKDEILTEIRKYTILFTYLGPGLIAASEEFIVDYSNMGKREIVLCGLQEYIEGEILDPWRTPGENHLRDLFTAMSETDMTPEVWLGKVKQNIARFVEKIRKMIAHTGYIPDLAGIGNLIVTRDGRFKLVDINNIVPLKPDDTILIDDKGYPSCDVSVDVLSTLERDVLQKSLSPNDPLYSHFLTPERKKQVRLLEKTFYSRLTA